MSSFEQAIATILLHEGHFVNNPHDPGGPTKFGISLSWLKQLGELDSRIYMDFDTNQDGILDARDISNLTEVAAMALYKTQWWDKYQYSQINVQRLATKVFDLAVNMGSKAAHRCLQRALRAAGVQLEEDGILGPKTMAAVNQTDPVVLLAALRSEAAGYYRSLNKPFYEKGWLNRAYY
ncbi:MAG: hypothetical protein K0S11_1776 [Gammaproteobacteria bacterium]|jgi:lysozyme family protein|nr:hypothetical protein [Gammaproteobacteria bacterium]